ncbi:hypothetical protein KAS79_02985 [Candidatus Parcubacteria bacterium]|nr:hypothetical protein [Candidatus Parcubacteria bacterium]
MAEQIIENISDEQIASSDVKPGKCSPLDIDFIMMLSFAFLVDVLDMLLDTLGLVAGGTGKVVGIAFDIITFLIIAYWMYQKEMKIGITGKLNKQLVATGKKAIKKIEKKIAKKIANKVLTKVLFKSGIAIIIEVLPGFGLFTSWTALVISCLF